MMIEGPSVGIGQFEKMPLGCHWQLCVDVSSCRLDADPVELV